MSANVKDALRAVDRAKAATPPTPATGRTLAPVGECNCPGSSHIGACAHFQGDINLAASGPHPCVEVHYDDETYAYTCGCGRFSSPSVVDIEAHQRAAK